MPEYQIDPDESIDDYVSDDEARVGITYTGGKEVVETKFECEVCDSQFDKKEQLNGHKSKHSKEEDSTVEEVIPEDED